MAFEYFPSCADGLLDALLDELAVDPTADVGEVLARVDQQHAARATGAQLEQRHTEKQQQRGEDLHQRWSELTRQHAPRDDDVDALVRDTHRYLAGLRSSVAYANDTRGSVGWRSPVPRPTSSSASSSSSLAPAMAVHTLLPLLTSLSTNVTTATTKGDSSAVSPQRRLRCAYLSVLPAALRTVAAAGISASQLLDPSQASTESAVVSWYCRFATEPALGQLLAPYLTSTTEPHEKALRYHFRAGRPTAALHEPQHFFAFLFDSLDRQHDTHQSTWCEDAAQTPLLVLLERLAQLALCAAAVVTFQDCYGWHANSSLWRSSDYVVVTVNALLDFVGRVEGRVGAEATRLLLDRLVVKDVALIYAAAGVTMAEDALRSGPARLWRRAFLYSGGPRSSPPLYTGSLHMMRSLEALVRRLLNTLLAVDATYAVLMWRKTVEPTLSHFLAEVESHAAEALETTWAAVVSLQWCVASVQIVAAAAEDWLGMLRECAAHPSGQRTGVEGRDVAAALATSDALDGLVLFRDTLARRTVEQAKALTRQVCTHKTGDAAQAAATLHGLDNFLQAMEGLPDGASRYVLQAVIQGVVQEGLSREQQTELAAFASRSGLHCVARLLAA